MLKTLTKTTIAATLAASFALSASMANANTFITETTLVNSGLVAEQLEPIELQPVNPILPPLPLPTKVSCNDAKKVIKNKGYKKVKKIECNGTVYTFKGKKNGHKYAIAINAFTQSVWTL